MKKSVMLLGLAALLSGCSSERPASLGQDPFHIAKVEAWGPAPAGISNDQLQHMRNETQALAVVAPETANPRLLRVRITGFHEKDPTMSLLIGDTNNMDVTGDILSMDGATNYGQVTARVNSEVFLNGVVGAVVAAKSNTDVVKRDLDIKAADAVLEKVYGTKSWKNWKKQRR